MPAAAVGKSRFWGAASAKASLHPTVKIK